MFDFTYIFLISLGLTTAKVDLNSHQPYSSPSFFSEASVRLQKENLNFFGLRFSHYNSTVQVRNLFSEKFGATHQINHLVSSLFVGKGLYFNPENYISLDAGIAYIFKDDKIGLPARLRYTRKMHTRKGKRYNLSASLGLEYWVEDNLDNYEDQTTYDGDYMFHFTVGVELPVGERP